MGQPFDLRLDALDEIREPVDDRFQEADQDRGPGLELRLRSVASRDIDGEGPGLGIAERDEPLSGKNEGDRRRSGLALLGLVQQRRGHIVGAVLLIEAARGLDLLLLLARGDLELKRPFDLYLLLRRGIEEIDPKGSLGDPWLALLALKRTGAVLIDGEHRTSLRPITRNGLSCLRRRRPYTSAGPVPVRQCGPG